MRRWSDSDMESNWVNQVGFMDNGTGQHQSNTVYDTRYLCPALTTVNGGGTQQIKVLIIEDFYQNRPIRCYESVSPVIRSERVGLKVLEIDNE